MHADPQNPYESFVVAASAGCGKTFQLAQRFLSLVGAGADPQRILTITFTKKAASEMRARILSEATTLLTDQSAQDQFEDQLKGFYQTAIQNRPFSLKPPRDAVETAESIIGASQQLRITTIDSMFWDWVRKFPWEASYTPDDADGLTLPTNFSLLEDWQADEFDKKALEGLVGPLSKSEDVVGLLKQYGLSGLTNRFFQLQNADTFLWLQQHHGSTSGFLPHQIIEDLPTQEELMEALSHPLSVVAKELNNSLAREIAQALAQRDLTNLLSLKIFNSDAEISGRFVRGAKKEKLASEINEINTLICTHLNNEKKRRLNRQGQTFVKLFEHFRNLRNQLKYEDNLIEFSDLTKGCYQLFHSADAASARYLIHQQVQHLLIDEFQDTSRLQWSIFYSLANELMSGEGLYIEQAPPPSLFLVGDHKQSIYGFREADPTVMDDALEQLSAYGAKEVPLNHSFRTAPLILDFVNHIFHEHLYDFPTHQAASLDGKQPVCPNYGRVVIAEPFEDATTPAESVVLEAGFVANQLKEWLIDQPLLVFDKQTKAFRPLQPSDCAILYRFSTQATHYEQALRQLGIPYQREEASGFFHRTEVIDHLALLRYLAWPCDLLSLTTFLKSPLAQISDSWLLHALSHHQEQSDTTRCQHLLAELSRVSELSLLVQQLHLQTAKLMPHQILLQIMSLFDSHNVYRSYFDASEADLAMANLHQLVEIIIKLENEGYTELSSLCERLNKLKDLHVFGNAPANTNAVTLSTIHKSKGLEYPLVMLVDAASQWEKRDRYWVKAKTGLYYTGTKAEQPRQDRAFDKIYELSDNELQDESLRLLYVALTRARQYLMVTGHKKNRSKDKRSFLHLILNQLNGLDFQLSAWHDHRVWLHSCQDPEILKQYASSQSKESPRAPDSLCLAAHSNTEMQTEIFSVSPHGLNSPTDSHPHGKAGILAEHASVFGTLVHKGLEAAIKKQTFDHNKVLQAQLMKEMAATSWPENLGSLIIKHIKHVLQSEVWQELTTGSRQLFAEYPIAYLRGKQLLRGQIDLLCERANGELWVIDYKTTPAHEDEHAFQPQIQAYCEAVYQIYECQRSVQGFVFFTNSLNLKPLNQVNGRPMMLREQKNSPYSESKGR